MLSTASPDDVARSHSGIASPDRCHPNQPGVARYQGVVSQLAGGFDCRHRHLRSRATLVQNVVDERMGRKGINGQDGKKYVYGALQNQEGQNTNASASLHHIHVSAIQFKEKVQVYTIWQRDGQDVRYR